MKLEECRVDQVVILEKYEDIDNVMMLLVGREAVVTKIHKDCAWIKVGETQRIWPILYLRRKDV